jgi:hypothetical protein
MKTFLLFAFLLIGFISNAKGLKNGKYEFTYRDAESTEGTQIICYFDVLVENNQCVVIVKNKKVPKQLEDHMNHANYKVRDT